MQTECTVCWGAEFPLAREAEIVGAVVGAVAGSVTLGVRSGIETSQRYCHSQLCFG